MADRSRAAGVGLPVGADGGVAESEQTCQDLLSGGVWFRRIYEESPIGIELYDSGGHLLDANQACLSLFGVSDVSEIRGFDLFADPNVPEEMRQRLREGRTVRYQATFDFDHVKRLDLYRTTRSGTIELDVLITPMRPEDGLSSGAYLVQVQDLTDRKRAEDFLRAREEQYRSLFENLLDGFAYHKIVVDDEDRPVDYVFIEINPAFERLTGLRRQDIVGRRVTEVLPGIERSEFDWIGVYGRVALRREPARFDQYSESLGRWYSVSAYSPEEGYFVALFSDITERKRAEEALQKAHDELEMRVEARTAELALANEELLSQSEKLRSKSEEAEHRAAELDTIIASIADAVVVFDQEEIPARMNLAAEKMLGYTLEEYRRPTAERIELLRMETADGKPLSVEGSPTGRAGRGETVHGMILRFYPPDGRTLWVSCSAAPIRTPDGNIGSVVTLTDISRLHELQDQLEGLLGQLEMERRDLQTMIDQMPEGVFIAEAPEGRVMVANAAARLLMGRDVSPGTPIDHEAQRYGLLRPDGEPYAPHELPLSRALRGEKVTRQEVVIRRPDGSEVTVMVNCEPVGSGEHPEKAIAVFQDISPLKEVERLREEFVHLVSHDLRNPLTSVLGNAHWLRRLLADRGLEKEVAAAAAISTSAWRMNAMIQDLVESARLESGMLKISKQPINLLGLLVDIAERIGTPEDRARVHVELAEYLPAVADPDRIERCIVNLITNALKYSPPGSPVVVRAAAGAGDVIVSVTDQGQGVPPEDLPRLFERFYRSKNAERTSEGLGLGLYITRLIVQAHGGRVWADSEVGMGSTFYISLPLT